MEQAINKLQDSVAVLADKMAIGFQKNEYNFQMLNRRMELLDRTVDTLGKKVDSNFESLNKRIDLLQGNSACTLESLERGINDVTSELQRILVVTRYKKEYFYFVNPKNGLPN